MKHRKSAVHRGQSKRVSTSDSDSGSDSGSDSDRAVVDDFYDILNERLRPGDEIEIIPPEQVNPTHTLPKQLFIVADYCIRKILPEVTGLYRWGDEITPRLRAVAPVVDADTARAAATVAGAAERIAGAAYYNSPYNDSAAYPTLMAATGNTRSTAASAAESARFAARAFSFNVACAAAYAIYHALVTCIEADHEGVYNRIIALTNEMLESL